MSLRYRRQQKEQRAVLPKNRSLLLVSLLAMSMAWEQSAHAKTQLSFQGETQACAGGVADALHTFELVAQVKDERGQPESDQALAFECAADAEGPRFLLPDGTLALRYTARPTLDGRVPLVLRSGKSTGTFRVIARAAGEPLGESTAAQPTSPALGEWTLRVVGAECLRRFPWRWVGQSDPNVTLSSGDERHDDGWLTTDPFGSGSVAGYKFYLKCRRDARRGDLNGNWSVVNGHRVRVWIREVRFSDPDRDAPDVVITDPRRIAQFWQLDRAPRTSPTQVTVVTRGDGAATVGVRRVKGRRLPNALLKREVNYALDYNDESQTVDDPPVVPLGFGKTPVPTETVGAVRLFTPPAGVEGTLAWTVEDLSSSKAPVPSEGLYVARLGEKHQGALRDLGTRYFPIGLSGEGASPTISPDGQSVIVGAEPEQGSIEGNYYLLTSLFRFDLTTGQSRALIATKDIRSGYRWSPDGRYLVFNSTSWFSTESPGAPGFYLYPCVLDLQTLRQKEWKDSRVSSGVAWAHGNRLLWDEYTLLSAVQSRPREYGHTMQAAASGGSPRLWRAGTWMPQSSGDGRQMAFLSLETPQQRRFLRTRGAVFALPFGTVLWAQDTDSAPRPITRVEERPSIFWSRDGKRMVSVTVEPEDSWEYWGTEVQREAQVTVWNWPEGTIEKTFALQGQLVKKASGYSVTESILPLELSDDGQTLFLCYQESDPKKATRSEVGSLTQGVLAIDIATTRPHLLATLKDIGEVAWRSQ